jgi:homoserine dehydrogenase
MIRVVIIGFGTVGQGVAKVLAARNNGKHDDIMVVALTDSKGAVMDPKGLDLLSVIKQKKDGTLKRLDMTSMDVVMKADYDVMVEVTPTDARTGEPGLSYIKAALARGKDVVTSNKGPVALKFRELKELADKTGAILRFEATVGGAMPVFNFVRGPLAGDRIKSIKGIFNGTCNYILTRMATESLPYDAVLSEAKELGIAEADPTYDVEGIDTALKLVILANAVFGMDVSLKDVDMTGISCVTLEALTLAGDCGYVVKLIGEVRPNGNDPVLKVGPRLVPASHPLAVQGTLNAAVFETEFAGDIMTIGKGAGSIETASAILSDLLDIAATYKKN